MSRLLRHSFWFRTTMEAYTTKTKQPTDAPTIVPIEVVADFEADGAGVVSPPTVVELDAVTPLAPADWVVNCTARVPFGSPFLTKLALSKDTSSR